MSEQKDVDLYAELEKTLKGSEEEEKSNGASSEKTQQEEKKPEKDTKVEPAKKEEDDKGGDELSEEEISKLSPRAQKRIRALADQVKSLAEKPAEKSPADSPKEKTADTQNFKNVQEFLNAVEDEPSRVLLEKFYGVIKGEISHTLSPIERQNNEAKFNEEFSKYNNIDGLADYKGDLLKTFMRNPTQSIRALIGETVLELQSSKVKSIEKTPPTPKHDGEVDIDGKSKDELYDLLESTKN